MIRIEKIRKGESAKKEKVRSFTQGTLRGKKCIKSRGPEKLGKKGVKKTGEQGYWKKRSYWGCKKKAHTVGQKKEKKQPSRG